MNPKRWAAVAVAVLLIISIYGAGLTRVVHQGTINCKATNAAAMRFNAALDQLIVGAAVSPALTPEQREQRIAKYASLHLIIVKCPSAGFL